MNIYLIVTLFIISYFILNDRDVLCKGRGGGSRGGGSRSGGSRSASRGGTYRSGSSGYRSSVKSRSIISSSRYNTWSVRVGVVSTTRYRVSPWSTQHRAILAGHIIMSSHQRSRFHMYDKKYYDDINICYNEEPLYQRNVTASPWFICPWDDISERFCCGSEVEERCCGYFERPGHMAGLVIGILLLIFLIMLLCLCYKKSYHSEKSTTVIYTTENKVEGYPGSGDGALLIYPPAPIDVQPMPISAPDYNNIPYPNYPPSSENNLPYPANLPYPTTNNNLPYPTNTNTMDNNAQYNTNPVPMDSQFTYPTYAPTTDSALPYPTNPNAANDQYSSQLPPSYDDALRMKN